MIILFIINIIISILLQIIPFTLISERCKCLKGDYREDNTSTDLRSNALDSSKALDVFLQREQVPQCIMLGAVSQGLQQGQHVAADVLAVDHNLRSGVR